MLESMLTGRPSPSPSSAPENQDCHPAPFQVVPMP